MKIIFILIFIILLTCLVIYNILVNRRNKVIHSKSNIDVYLSQRFNLIPNLVQCVKEYTNYENKILEEIVKIRTEYMNTKNITTGRKLNEKINYVIFQIEKYPELKANEQFLLLQKNLIKMENQIQAARRIYNLAVQKYNNLVCTFPTNIIAKIIKYEEEKFFGADNESKESINIQIGE